MYLDPSHPLNATVLRHIERVKHRDAVPISDPDDHPDPYMQAGSHPDIVERVWDQLGRSLPVDCRAMLYGGPALVEPRSGLVIALAYGTQYVIRIPQAYRAQALESGCSVEQSWTTGGKTNISETLGEDWVFGGYVSDESAWLAETCAAVAAG